MTLRPLYLVFVGIAILTTVLFIRTTGIHIDENNYLSMAMGARAGDSLTAGKPPLFYFINYKVYNEIARWWGPLRPVSLYLFYIAAFAVSLVWALAPLYEGNPRLFAAVFLALLVSPLALLNATQLMMETAMFPVVSLLFGAVIRGADRKMKLIRIALFSAILVALKVTGAAIAVLLAAVVWRRSKVSSAALAAGALAGYLGNTAALLWLVRAQSHIEYGGVFEVLNVTAVFDRIAPLRENLYAWLFFAGFPAVAAIYAFTVSRWRSEPADTRDSRYISDGALIALLGGALGMMLFLQAIAIYGFQRYTYPTLWLGLIAAVVLLARHRRGALAFLTILFFFQSSALWWGTAYGRFSFWPHRTVFEFMESGVTIHAGTPIHRLVVGQLLRDAAPCYDLGAINTEEQGFYRQYFNFAFPEAHVSQDAERCATTIRVWKDPVDAVGACPDRCGATSRWSGCAYQRIAYFSVREGITLNQVCW